MQSRISRAVCVVTKDPWRDEVKTRLAQGIGAKKAQAVAGLLLQCVVEGLQRLIRLPPPAHSGARQSQDLRIQAKLIQDPIDIYFALPSLPPSSPLLGLLASNESGVLQLKLIQQRPGDLGEKLKGVFEDLFALAHDEVAVIGSDSPLLTAELMNEGFVKLSDAPWVVAPTADGGFASLAARASYPPAFDGVRWSTRHTLQDLVDAQCKSKDFQKLTSKKTTLESADVCIASNTGQQKPQHFHFLKEVSDVDTLEDLLKVQKTIRRSGQMTSAQMALTAFHVV